MDTFGVWVDRLLFYWPYSVGVRRRARIRLANRLIRLQRYEEAISVLRINVLQAQQRTMLGGNARGLEAYRHLRIAHCLRKLGRTDEADAERKAAFVCLKEPAQTGDIEASEQAYAQIVRIYAGHPEAQAEMQHHAAAVYFDLQQCERALGYANQAVSNARLAAQKGHEGSRKIAVRARLLCGKILRRLQKLDEAEADAREAIAWASEWNETEPLREAQADLASHLLALGRTEEAVSSAQAAGDLPTAQAVLADYHLKCGAELEAQGRAVEATTHFKNALALPVMDRPNQAANRARSLVQMALACYGAGQPDETVQRAQEAIALKPDNFEVRLQAHSAAALGYSAQGRRSEALHHRQLAYDLSLTNGDETKIGETLTHLAMEQYYAGRLDEALASCERALRLKPRYPQTAFITQSDCYRAQGRFDPAREALQAARAAAPYPNPAAQARALAVNALGFAFLEADAENWQAAAVHLQEAREGLQADARITGWCSALGVVLDAAEGRLCRFEAPSAFEAIAQIAGAASLDRETQFTCWGSLGRAALALREFEKSIEFWQRYLALTPKPVHLPTALFRLGEAWHGLRDEAQACEAWRRAVDCGVETRYTALARQRLAT